MALSKLVIGQKVLVVTKECGHDFGIGQIITVKEVRDGDYNFSSDGVTWYLQRREVLAIGDEVVRGPDMFNDTTMGERPCHNTIGKVIDFENMDRNVQVKWGNGSEGSYRMNADHQDLKPTGDSEAREEDKPECWGRKGECITTKIPCVKCEHEEKDGSCRCNSCKSFLACRKEAKRTGFILTPVKESGICGMEVTAVVYDECTDYKPIKEEVMTRKAQAKQRDESVEAKRKMIEEKKEAHAEEIAVLEESIVTLQAEAADFRKYTTDKEATAAKIIAAKNLDGKATPKEQAEAILWCSNEEIDL